MLPDSREKLPEGGICREQFTQKDATGLLPTPVKEKSLNCGICKKKFTRKNYAVHLLAHMGGKCHECKTCKKKFMQKSLLAEHEQTHTEQNIDDRETCEQVSKVVFFKHLSAQKEEQSNECGICNKKFTCKSSVTRHLIVHTRERDCGGMNAKKVKERKPLSAHAGQNSHICKICGKKFSSRRNVKRHLLIHAKAKSKGEMQSKNFIEQNIVMQKGENAHVCGECGKEFSSQRNVKRHLLIHVKERAKGEMQPNSLSEIAKLLPIHTAGNSHACGVCGKNFSSRRNVKRHLLIHAKEKAKGVVQSKSLTETSQGVKLLPVHTGKNSHVCGICGKIFGSRRNVTRHMRIHTKEKVQKTLTQGNQIEKLLPVHIGRSSNMCGLCGKKFSCKSSVTRHFLTHVKGKISQGGVPAKNLTEGTQVPKLLPTNTMGNSLRCGICGRKFASQRNVTRHMFIHTREKAHVGGIQSNNLIENKLAKQLSTYARKNPKVCKVCGKKFSCKSSATRHKRIHEWETASEGEMLTKNLTGVSKLLSTNTENSHICEVCGKKFASRRNVKRHLLIHAKGKASKGEILSKNLTEVSKPLPSNTKENSHVCRICGKEFASKKNVKRHLVIHRKEKAQLHCENLEKGNQVLNLLSAGNSLTCGICNKAFSCESHVKRHMITHTGQKDHMCRICGKKFTCKSSVMRHLLTHAGKKGNEDGMLSKQSAERNQLVIRNGGSSHVCGVCGKKFSSSRNVTRHLLIHKKKAHEDGMHIKKVTEGSENVASHLGEENQECEKFTCESSVTEKISDESGICGVERRVFTHTGVQLTSDEWKLLNSPVKVVLEDISAVVRYQEPADVEHSIENSDAEEVMLEDIHSFVGGDEPSSFHAENCGTGQLLNQMAEAFQA